MDEQYKIRVTKLVNEFRDSPNKHFSLPKDLDNKERRYVHELCKKLGLSSKSAGKGADRFLTVTKPSFREIEAPELKLKKECEVFLNEYFAKNPMTQEELTFVYGNSSRAPHLKMLSKDHFVSKKVDSLPILSARPKSIPPVHPDRLKLPIWHHKKEILDCIHESDITIISGETGSGKSTQVAQFLLDDNVNSYLICTQPRRLPAISLAERVAEERGEFVGKSIGYSVRFESSITQETRCIYCTTGVALSWLRNGLNESRLNQVTHFLIDEVHERDRNTDFMLTFLRERILAQNSPNWEGSKIKVILMSATIQMESFFRYFTQVGATCSTVHVKGTAFPVHQVFLEDIVVEVEHYLKETLKFKSDMITDFVQEDVKPLEPGDSRFCCPLCHLQCANAQEFGIHAVTCEANDWEDVWGESNAAKSDSQDYHTQSPAMKSQENEEIDISKKRLAMLRHYFSTRDGEEETEVDIPLIVALLEQLDKHDINHFVTVEEQHLAQTQDDDASAILIFLPGWNEISTLIDTLKAHVVFGDVNNYLLLPLHSGIPTKDQRKVFSRPSRGVRKIVCATNIAETSITIEDIVYVIDSGLVKEKGYDAFTKSSSLLPTFISKASARQRRGRAGRCRVGVSFHLYSATRYQSFIEEQVPEILRTPLEELCLHAKSLITSSNEILRGVSIRSFLLKSLDSPLEKSIVSSIENLICMGALDGEENLTSLGRFLASVPVEPKLGKLILYGSLFHATDIAILLSVTSGYRDPFIFPTNPAEKFAMTIAKQRFARSVPALKCSDHVAILGSIHEFNRNKTNTYGFCSRNSLSFPTLDSINSMKQQVEKVVETTRFRNRDQSENFHTIPPATLSVLICWATSQNFAALSGKKLVCGKHKRINFHVSSSLKPADLKDETTEFYTFEELVRGGSGSNSIRVVSGLNLLVMALCAGKFRLCERTQPNNLVQEENEEEDDDDETDSFQLFNKNETENEIRLNSWARIVCERKISEMIACLRLRFETHFLNGVERGSFSNEDFTLSEVFIKAISFQMGTSMKPHLTTINKNVHQLKPINNSFAKVTTSADNKVHQLQTNPAKKQVKGNGGTPIQLFCSSCRQKGHNISNCPKSKPKVSPIQVTCLVCYQKGHHPIDCPNRNNLICEICEKSGHVYRQCEKFTAMSPVEKQDAVNRINRSKISKV